MINYNLIQICSYSILIAVLIGLIRFRRIDPSYQPFIYIMTISLINEIVSPFFVEKYKTNAININVLIVIEYILWLWQFKYWGIFDKKKQWRFYSLLIILPLGWLIENIVFGRIFIFNSIFSLVSAFILVFLAIDQVNKLIVEEKKTLIRNSKFLISCGIIIFHTYEIMVDSFYVMKLDQSNHFLSNIFIILVFVNLFVNLLFALATLWIPTRQKFTMQY